MKLRKKLHWRRLLRTAGLDVLTRLLVLVDNAF